MVNTIENWRSRMPIVLRALGAGAVTSIVLWLMGAPSMTSILLVGVAAGLGAYWFLPYWERRRSAADSAK